VNRGGFLHTTNIQTFFYASYGFAVCDCFLIKFTLKVLRHIVAIVECIMLCFDVLLGTMMPKFMHSVNDLERNSIPPH